MTTTQKYDPVTYRSGTTSGRKGNVFSSNLPHRAQLLCYIAGIECPITGASVQYGVWQIPEATVTLFPDPTLQRFGAEDRVPIVLFYLDEYIEPTKPTWRMLFEGEVVGWSYTNSPLGRSLSLSCLMDIAVWTQLFVFYMTTLSGVVQGYMSGRQDASQINQSVAVYPYSLFKKGLISNEKDQFITRPFDLAYNAVRGLISKDVPQKQRCVPAVNFFSRWVRRNQFHNKWVALPFLDEQHDANGQKVANQPPGVFPVLRAVQAQQAIEAMADQVTTDMSGASMYTLLKRILDTVYMELSMLPTPAAVGTYTNGSIVGPPTLMTPTATSLFLPESSFKEGANTGLLDPQKPIRLTNYFVKPQMFFGLPPVCNVVFPSMTPRISYQENYATQPTRLYFQDDSLMSLLPTQTKVDLKNYLLTVLARAYPPEADYKYQEHLKQGSNASGTGKNLLIYPEEFFKGPVTARYPAPQWLMFVKKQLQGQGIPSGTPTGDASSKTVTPEGSSLTDNDLYILYAKYEYFKQRFSQRNGAVELAFQPYLVPGFPMMIFDDFQDKMHLVGYLMNVAHQFSSRGVLTSANFSYARTIYEFFQDVKNEMENPEIESRKNLATAAAPLEPIPEIRDVVQHFHKADQFYQSLFYKRPTAPKKSAVFEYRNLLSFVNSDGTLEDIKIEGTNEETLAKDREEMQAAIEVIQKYLNDPIRRAAIAIAESRLDTVDLRKAIELGLEQSITKITPTQAELAASNLENKISSAPVLDHNLSLEKDITPKPGNEAYFDSYDAAMRYCSRPICTLEEYIFFINGVREGIHDDAVYDDGSTIKSARYYKRIRKLTGATTETTNKITLAQQGLKGDPLAVGTDFPDMRAKWDELILAYRTRVYSANKVSR